MRIFDGLEIAISSRKDVPVAQTLVTSYSIIAGETALPSLLPTDLKAKVQQETQRLAGTIERFAQAETLLHWGEYARCGESHRVDSDIAVARINEPGITAWLTCTGRSFAEPPS
jgi:hypothetical protein